MGAHWAPAVRGSRRELWNPDSPGWGLASHCSEEESHLQACRRSWGPLTLWPALAGSFWA